MLFYSFAFDETTSCLVLLLKSRSLELTDLLCRESLLGVFEFFDLSHFPAFPFSQKKRRCPTASVFCSTCSLHFLCVPFLVEIDNKNDNVLCY